MSLNPDLPPPPPNFADRLTAHSLPAGTSLPSTEPLASKAAEMPVSHKFVFAGKSPDEVAATPSPSIVMTVTPPAKTTTSALFASGDEDFEVSEQGSDFFGDFVEGEEDLEDDDADVLPLPPPPEENLADQGSAIASQDAPPPPPSIETHPDVIMAKQQLEKVNEKLAELATLAIALEKELKKPADSKLIQSKLIQEGKEKLGETKVQIYRLKLERIECEKKAALAILSPAEQKTWLETKLKSLQQELDALHSDHASSFAKFIKMSNVNIVPTTRNEIGELNLNDRNRNVTNIENKISLLEKEQENYQRELDKFPQENLPLKASSAHNEIVAARNVKVSDTAIKAGKENLEKLSTEINRVISPQANNPNTTVQSNKARKICLIIAGILAVVGFVALNLVTFGVAGAVLAFVGLSVMLAQQLCAGLIIGGFLVGIGGMLATKAPRPVNQEQALVENLKTMYRQVLQVNSNAKFVEVAQVLSQVISEQVQTATSQGDEVRLGKLVDLQKRSRKIIEDCSHAMSEANTLQLEKIRQTEVRDNLTSILDGLVSLSREDLDPIADGLLKEELGKIKDTAQK